uniref:Uncharacterized protein n=1 Tax=Tanacetum cinerariifolium TaxID=118510 RepID=A0A6L2LEK8_TANCI|nr:hypothetical protein [Tanacetum cinerariifolium]
MLVIKIFSERRKVSREGKKCEKICVYEFQVLLLYPKVLDLVRWFRIELQLSKDSVITHGLKNDRNGRRNTRRIDGSSGNNAYGQKATRNTTTIQRIPRTSTNSGNMPTMLLAKKDKAGIHLSDEENDFLLVDATKEEDLEELNASFIIMARLQTVNNDSDIEPMNDYDFVSEVHDFTSNFINEIFSKGNHEQHYPEKPESIKPKYDNDLIDSNVICDDPNVEVNSENVEQDTNDHDQQCGDIESLIRNV